MAPRKEHRAGEWILDAIADRARHFERALAATGAVIHQLLRGVRGSARMSSPAASNQCHKPWLGSGVEACELDNRRSRDARGWLRRGRAGGIGSCVRCRGCIFRCSLLATEHARKQ